MRVNPILIIYITLVVLINPLFLSSSVVERSAVNRLVTGSNPVWGEQLRLTQLSEYLYVIIFDLVFE